MKHKSKLWRVGKDKLQIIDSEGLVIARTGYSGTVDNVNNTRLIAEAPTLKKNNIRLNSINRKLLKALKKISYMDCELGCFKIAQQAIDTTERK